MTTQQHDIKASLRIGKMFNEAGELHHFELSVMNRTTHYAVELNIYKGDHKVANLIKTETRTALTVESARTMWAELQKAGTAGYAVTEHETDTKVLGQEYKNTKWVAEPAGDVRTAKFLAHDCNEGWYSVTVDYTTLALTFGGTRAAADVPAEFDTETFTNRAALEVAYAAKVADVKRRWVADRLVVTYSNFVTKVTRFEQTENRY